ncbi:hypothetical protein [Thermotoga sp. RQ7]|uniref:hypothetical protein n=1 Tax=Thermotoga sp. RQ7 TaxID=126738 RepID=UPI001438AAD4|nr:hypothetical protein [Thermotoga sp. RQ7]
MMPYIYRCTKCGAIYYSATSIEYQLNKNCEKCGGELEQLGEEGELMKKEEEKEKEDRKK